MIPVNVVMLTVCQITPIALANIYYRWEDSPRTEFYELSRVIYALT